MSVSYRWKNETGPFREINILNSPIRVADLKVLIAERSGLAHEFARKIDIHLIKSDVKTDASENPDTPSTTIYYDEDELIEPFTQVVAIRDTWKSHQDIIHQARTELTEEEWKTQSLGDLQQSRKTKKPVPQELLCSICDNPMIEPMLLKCPKNCGSNACRKCLKKTVDDLCPTCGKKIIGIIQNAALDRLIEITNWESFDVKQGRSSNQLDEDSSVRFLSTSPPSHLSDTPSSRSQKVTFTDTTSTDSAVVFFVTELSMHNLSLLRSYDILLLEKGSNLYNFISNGLNSIDSVSIMACAQVGGGTSYAIGGFFSIFPTNELEILATNPGLNAVIKSWQHARKLSQNIRNETEHFYMVQWEEKYDTMPMLPLRKQPLWGILNQPQKQNKFSGKIHASDRYHSSEVNIQPVKFEELKVCINEYIKFGSRPVETTSRPDKINYKASVTSSPDSLINKHKDVFKNTDINENLTAITTTFPESNLNSILLPQDPPSLTIDGKIDMMNPYIGYCSSLPFLSEELFENIKKIQKAAKFFVAKRNLASDSNVEAIHKPMKKIKQDINENLNNCTSSSSTSSSDSDVDSIHSEATSNNSQNAS